MRMINMQIMKHVLILLLVSITLDGFSQSKETRKINRDSLEWEKQGNVFLEGDHLNKLEISKNDSIVRLYSNIRLDHRIFGYEKPDLGAKKKILFSVFTFDVEDNPCNCAFGSFYETSSMKGITMKYIGKEKSFVKVAVLKNNIKLGDVYFEKKWVEFE